MNITKDIATEYLNIPKLNPFQFVKLANGIDSFFKDSIPGPENKTRYCQIWEAEDSMAFQIRVKTNLLETTTSYVAELVDKDEVIYYTFFKDIYGVVDGWTYAHFRKVLQWNGGTPFPEGTYYIRIRLTLKGGTVDTYYTEPIHIKQTHENSILLEYRHSENDYDMIMQPQTVKYAAEIAAGTKEPLSLIGAAPLYRMRVKGGLYSKDSMPSANDVIYTDQTASNKILSSQPFTVWNFTYGDNSGLPNWISDKINRIFSCEFVRIDKKDFYTKIEGATIQQVFFHQRFPKGAWSLEVTSYENLYHKKYKGVVKLVGIGQWTIGSGFKVSYSPAIVAPFVPVLDPVKIATALNELNGENIPTSIIDKIDGAKDSKEDIRQAIIAKGVAVGTEVPLSDYDDKIATIGSTCADASWELQDTAGATLKTGTIPSGGSDLIEAPDAAYEVKYTPSGTPIASGLVKSGGSVTVPVPDPVPCEGWSPPTDWIDISGLVTTADTNKVAFTYAVWEKGRNFLSLLCRAAYNVKIYTDATLTTLISDTNVNDNVQYNTELFWADTIAATFCTRGYRQVVVIVTPQGAANLTVFRTNVNHPNAGSQSGRQILAFYSALANITTTAVATFALIGHSFMEICEYVVGLPANCSVSYNATKKLKVDFQNAAVSGANVADYHQSLLELEVLNSSNVTNFSAFGRFCSALTVVNEINCAGADSLQNMFGTCPMLNGTKLTNTVNVTDIRTVNIDNYASRYFIADNLTAVTLTLNAWRNNYNLSYMEVPNLGVSFSVQNSNLAYEMVVEIGNNQLKDLTALTTQDFDIRGTPASLHANIAAYAVALLASKNWNLIIT